MSQGSFQREDEMESPSLRITINEDHLAWGNLSVRSRGGDVTQDVKKLGRGFRE